jgi:hypothetical protein
VTHWNEQERVLIATRASCLFELANAEATAINKA